jgi:hypothetical protein
MQGSRLSPSLQRDSRNPSLDDEKKMGEALETEEQRKLKTTETELQEREARVKAAEVAQEQREARLREREQKEVTTRAEKNPLRQQFDALSALMIQRDTELEALTRERDALKKATTSKKRALPDDVAAAVDRERKRILAFLDDDVRAQVLTKLNCNDGEDNGE